MNDLTLLYYTANRIKESCAERVRNHLLETTDLKFPIISVSQKPINFGRNICVGDIGQSFYNCYKQIYIGVKEVKTKYVACCEDDTLYNAEHFSYRPSADDIFSYNCNLWYTNGRIFWQRNDIPLTNTGMSCCIALTELLRRNLEIKFRKCPIEPLPRTKESQIHWQEPGRKDEKFGINDVKVEYFTTKDPIVGFNRRGTLSGKQRQGGVERIEIDCLEPFGKAIDVWKHYWKKS